MYFISLSLTKIISWLRKAFANLVWSCCSTLKVLICKLSVLMKIKSWAALGRQNLKKCFKSGTGAILKLWRHQKIWWRHDLFSKVTLCSKFNFHIITTLKVITHSNLRAFVPSKKGHIRKTSHQQNMNFWKKV